MNREIKFRGYDKFDKRWVYGYGLHQSIFIDGSSNAYVTAGIREVFIVDKESAGQYTGCKDANDKEIYEGDIIRLEGVDDREIGSTWEHIGKIVYKRGAFFVCYFDYYADGDEELICDAQVEFGTVIGNIYENKNLLEED